MSEGVGGRGRAWGRPTGSYPDRPSEGSRRLSHRSAPPIRPIWPFLMLALLVCAACARSEAPPVRSPFDDRGPQPTLAPGVATFPPPFGTPFVLGSATATP